MSTHAAQALDNGNLVSSVFDQAILIQNKDSLYYLTGSQLIVNLLLVIRSL
jgi:hypothetical protein